MFDLCRNKGHFKSSYQRFTIIINANQGFPQSFKVRVAETPLCRVKGSYNKMEYCFKEVNL